MPIFTVSMNHIWRFPKRSPDHALGINRHGLIVGIGTVADDGPPGAVAWPPKRPIRIIDADPINILQASAVNDLGEIAGFSSPSQAVVWIPQLGTVGRNSYRTFSSGCPGTPDQVE